MHKIRLLYKVLGQVLFFFFFQDKKSYKFLLQTEIAENGKMQGYQWLHLYAIKWGYVVSQNREDNWSSCLILQAWSKDVRGIRGVSNIAAKVPMAYGLVR